MRMKYLRSYWPVLRSTVAHTTRQKAWSSVKNFSTARPLCAKHHRHNILIMGSPGSGKSVVSQALGTMTGRKVIDIDGDFLEDHWRMTVAEKLANVGGERFLVEEGQALLQFTPPENSIISLTGSNPLHSKAWAYTKTLGTLVFLDVDNSVILERLHRMNVQRIVGQEEGTPMSEILDFRQQFYEGNYDIRVICGESDSVEDIAHKVQQAIKHYDNNDGYVSTRYNSATDHAQSFNDVVLEGLAPDGGLYVPSKGLPHFLPEQLKWMTQLSYSERALRILEAWIPARDLHPAPLANMINRVYNANNFADEKIFPTVHLDGNVYVNELFYGPTASFKDAGLQLLPQFFQHAQTTGRGANHANDKYLFLVATSGDTGGAVLSGFNSLANTSDSCRVMVLYPEQGVSEVQKQQMKSFQGPGLNVVGVNSDFDFCQSTIKKIFNDRVVTGTLRDQYNTNLSAANSINWGRLLPQIVYHASSYLDLVHQKVINIGDPVDLCIPTGNFGNILAAYYAKCMGIPFRRLICASNVNNVLTDFFNTGSYDLTNRKLHVTASPAIDILRSSNLERYLYHVSGGDAPLVRQLYQDLAQSGKFTVSSELLSKIQEDIVGDWCTEEECSHAIRNTFNSTGYLLDPHTAVAKEVADRFNKNDCPLIISSTGHYAKFASDVLASMNPGQRSEFKRSNPSDLFGRLEEMECRPQMHRVLKQCMSKAVVHKTVLEPNVNNVVDEVYKFVEKSF